MMRYFNSANGLKTTFSPEKVTAQTASKSGSNCLVAQVSDTYEGSATKY